METELGQDVNERITDLLLEKDEVSWKTLLYELVREEEMDPWDVDVQALADKFLDLIQQLQEMDFRITGKLVLAAALLVKIKSDQLLEEDITALDNLIEGAEEPVELVQNLPEPYEVQEETPDPPGLVPKTPQPRTRQVALHDLVGALEKALQVEMRRTQRERGEEGADVDVDVDEIDMSKIITEVYEQVYQHYQDEGETVPFDALLPDDAHRHEKVLTFMPLLHLDHQRNVDLQQEQSFEPIFIEFLQELDQDFYVEEGDLGT